MPTFQFSIFSTTNLTPDPGPPPSSAIGVNQTNGNPQNGDTFTVGAQTGQTITVEDTENDIFEDDIDTPQFLEEEVTVNGQTFPIGTQVQNEFTLITDQPDGNGGFVEIVVLRFQATEGSPLFTTAYAATGPLPPGTQITITGTINQPSAPNATPFSELICFVAGTMIQTDHGEVAIETLAIGDRVVTLDRGAQAILWIGSRTIGSDELRENLKLRPICIKAGSLAQGLPADDLLVSPQHRILLRSKIAQRMFDSSEILVSAKHLLGLPGVEIAQDVGSVTYIHLMCENHEIVEVNGALSETLYTGTEAMKALSLDAREEIDSIFGETPYLERASARPTPKGKLSKKLIERHVKNEKPLVSAL